MEIVNKILEWPVIVQGALGSLLFWLVLTLGQRIIHFGVKKIKSDNDLGSYWGKTARNQFLKGNIEISNFSFFVSIYGALHYFLKFIIVVFISYLIKGLIPVFGYVGFFIGFYLIFRSISYVTHFNKFTTKEEKEEYKRAMEKEK